MPVIIGSIGDIIALAQVAEKLTKYSAQVEAPQPSFKM
jgi:hypothetical protein